MAPLTWRNVDAPNFANSIAALDVSGRGFSNASRDLVGAIDSYQEGRTQANSAQLMENVLRNRTPAELSTALSNGILGGLDPRYINGDALDFAANYQATLLKNDLANRELGLRAARGGGRGSGGGGKDDFVDVNKQGIRGYYDADGNIVNNAVDGPASAVPAVASAPVATTVNGQTVALPTVESEAGAPITSEALSQIAPTIDNAAALSTGSPVGSSAPAPVAASDIAFGTTPTPGPIRVGTPKGKDGYNQRNFELAIDAVNDRGLAYAGDPTAAIANIGNNARYLLNGTVSNNLTLTDNAIEAAAKGQTFRKGASEERKRDREESDELKARASNEIARVAADEAMLSSTTADEAKLNLARRLNAGEIDVDTFRRGSERVDNNRETFSLFTDPLAPPSSTPSGESQSVEPTAENQGEGTGKAASGISKAATAPATTSARDPLAGTAVGEEYAAFTDRINLDQSGDLNADFRSKFNQASNSKETVSDLANRATGKDGAFSGSNRDDYLNTLNDIRTRYRVTPAVAALMLESSQAGRSRLNRALWGDLFNGSVYVNEEQLDQLGRMITDPTTGRVRPQLLQENSARRESEATQTKLKGLYDEAGKAQAAFVRATSQVQQGRDPEKLKLKELEEKAALTQQRVSAAISEATQRGGPASAYRGDTAEAPVAEVPPSFFPRERPTETVIPQQVTARAEAIYQQLVDQSNRQLTRRELLDLRQRARQMAIEQVANPNAQDAIARASRGN